MKNNPSIICLFAVFLLPIPLISQVLTPPELFQFNPTSGSGLLVGQVQIDAEPAESGDWIAAFDQAGNCAGASQIVLNSGLAYFSLVIYANDATTIQLDEGMDDGEGFSLQVFDASEQAYYVYYSEQGETYLAGWQNTNGAPLPGLSNSETVWTFSSLPYIPDCLDPDACNFNPASLSSNNCNYPDIGYNCDGDCWSDVDLDGICDANEITGCTDSDACNFDPFATEDGECQVVVDGYDCNGECLVDSDGDGVCDVFEVLGCTDGLACNFSESATESDDSCTYPEEYLDCFGNCLEDSDLDGVCDGLEVLGCQIPEACNYDPNATENSGCIFMDALGECGGICLSDQDADGVCDDEDDCVGNLDECGVCNGQGAIYDCGCSPIPIGSCDCNGNVSDALGVCGGDCEADQDGDGVCDADEVLGCQDPLACNFNLNATEAGDCSYADPDFDCNGICLIDSDGDGVCDGNEILGCTNPMALNFDPASTEDDGSCQLPSPPPPSFEFTGTPASGTIFGQATLDGEAADEGDWVAAFDGLGNCAGSSPLIFSKGIAYINLTIYGDDATTPDVDEGISGNEAFYLVLWDESAVTTIYYGGGEPILGWTNTNGAPIPGFSDPSAIYEFLTIDASPNCNDPQACNFDPDASLATGCIFPVYGLDCDGSCLLDEDNDGVCNQFEFEGCTNSVACNFSADATENDGSCVFPAIGYDCNGECLADSDSDGICDSFEIPGCTSPNACNYNEQATDEDDSCTYATLTRDCDGECFLDSDDDGVCDQDEILGCTDATACDFLAEATDSGTCSFPDSGYDCFGNCLNDYDSNGVCDDFEGCMDNAACNFNPDALQPAGICEYPDFGLDCFGSCAGDLDEDGVCDAFEIPGCTYPTACNYEPTATDDNGNCIFVPEGRDCQGDCIVDSDDDGVCDIDEVQGCMDNSAINFNALATDENGSCVYDNCPSDLDGDGIVNVGDVLILLGDYETICSE